MTGPLAAGGKNHFNSYKNSLFADKEKEKKASSLSSFSFIHRLVYVATTNTKCDDKSSVTEHYEKLFKKFRKSTLVTGILLTYPKCIIHILESTSEVLTQILKDLSDMEKNPDAPLRETRVLVNSYIVESRIFPSWDFCCVMPPLSLQEDQGQPLETLVPECLATIYRFCMSLVSNRNGCSKQDVKEPSLVLQETVLLLCQNQRLHSPSSFLQAYNILLDWLDSDWDDELQSL